MSDLPTERTEIAFDDFKPAYTPAQAMVEANRCLYCFDAPCITACPTSIDIPTFIRKIATGNVRNAARTIFDQNILGMSCARVCPVETLCVGDCVYNHMGIPPIQIGKLQRYATDAAFAAGWEYYEAGPDTGKSVGIIGAGPAGLACAHALRVLGHGVTIYEKRDVVGGLNTTGVAPYKMKADRSVIEADWVLAIGGIEVRTGLSIPDDITWEALESAHDALFIGVGLGPDSLLDIVGADLMGIHGAVEYIEALKTGTVDLDGIERALVIGGGNTALDVVRELAGLGVPDVAMVYRGTEDRMSGYAHEWQAAKQEGVRAIWQTVPVGYLGADRVTGVRCVKLDADKRRIPGSEHDIKADAVFLAIGQAKLAALVEDLDGIETQWGRVVVDENRATGRPGVYAGGDCINGGKEVVNAVADGRDAARAIDAYIRGGK